MACVGGKGRALIGVISQQSKVDHIFIQKYWSKGKSYKKDRWTKRTPLDKVSHVSEASSALPC